MSRSPKVFFSFSDRRLNGLRIALGVRDQVFPEAEVSVVCLICRDENVILAWIPAPFCVEAPRGRFHRDLQLNGNQFRARG